MRARRAIRVLAISTAVTFVVVIAVYARFGHGALEAVWSDPSSPWRSRLGAVLRPNNLHATLVAADRAFGEAMALFASAASLSFLVAGLALARPGWLRGLAVLLLWWLAVETLAAPHLIYRLGLNHYAFVRDPDHWPPGVTGVPGWNSDGLRQDREAEDYAPEDFCILFLGDSFTMGFKLKHAEVDAFPWIVEGALQERFPDARLKVANFGWTSSSPLLSARRLEAIGAKYHPDLVVLCVDMGDANDDLKYRNLIERRGLCKLYDKLPIAIAILRAHAPQTWWRLFSWSVGHNQPYLRFFWTEEPLEASRPFLAELEANIARCRDDARALGADFACVLFPRYFQYTDQECPLDRELEKPFATHSVLGPYVLEPFRWFEELAQRVDYPVISLLPAFRDTRVHPHTFENDAHWNRDGHRIAAGALARELAPWVAARRARQEH